VIASLLGQQTRKISAPAAIDALEDCERRVQAMALVHEQLYSTETLDRINFSKYIQELATELHHACLPDVPGVRLRVEADAVEIGVHMAIPLGLILNELVFNAFKYAFDGRTGGEVLIEFHGLADGNLTLSVQDDGIGIPESVDWRKATSLGLRIVQILAQQLGGALEKTEGPGTGFRLKFPILPR
jgi:two-component sensor histidine kinase